MPPKINNLTELNTYLEELEKRIAYLQNGIKLQAREIHELRTNTAPKANNKDVIDYLKREKRNKIIVRIALAILGCLIAIYLLIQISNSFAGLQPVGPIP